MPSPFFFTRAGLGLAVTAIEKSVALPGRLAGGAVRTYLHVGQTANELASKGDRVLDSVFRRSEDQPEWVTFDEDVDSKNAGGAEAGGTGPRTHGITDLADLPDASAPEGTGGFVRDGAVIRSDDDAPGN